MFSWLKKHFIPHRGNDHRPHILRDDSARRLIAIVIFLEVFSFLIPAIGHLNMTGGMAAVMPAVLAALTNEEREDEDLPTLTVNPILNAAAEMKARDMAAKGYFAHTSPEGKTPWYWLEQAGYEYQYAGENLAINFTDSKDVTEAWMDSPTHRANIVKGNYTEIGTGVATGMYEGRETIFVAQGYANPLSVPVPVRAIDEPVVQPNPVEQPSQPAEPAPEPQPTPIPTPEPVVEPIPEPVLEPIRVAVSPVEPENILGAEDPVSLEPEVAAQPLVMSAVPAGPTLIQRLLASPRNTTNMMLSIVFTVMLAALLLYMFVKVRNHHLDLITNGLAVMALIGAIFVGNYYFTHQNMVITSTFDYAREVSMAPRI